MCELGLKRLDVDVENIGPLSEVAGLLGSLFDLGDVWLQPTPTDLVPAVDPSKFWWPVPDIEVAPGESTSVLPSLFSTSENFNDPDGGDCNRGSPLPVP